jgi:outer membrane protein assembly factor BamB
MESRDRQGPAAGASGSQEEGRISETDHEQESCAEARHDQDEEVIMKIPDHLRGKQSTVSAPEKFASGIKKGWRVEFPAGKPLATPTIVNGKVYLGGGFGSYDFFALDAVTGRQIWHYQTADDGPTAAIVEEDYIVFNTESCELEVLTLQGESLWKKWLGDPLTSMPAAGGGRVFMAFPCPRDHVLACFDLRTGTELWQASVGADLITAPVLAEERVFLATIAGTIYCFDQADGRLVWKDEVNATSAPTVLAGQCYYSQRREEKAQESHHEEQEVAAGAVQEARLSEQTQASSSKAAQVLRSYGSTARRADYLDLKAKLKSILQKKYEHHDAAVGFAMHKGHAHMALAGSHLGLGTVASMWSFQGSKPFVHGGRLYSSMGDSLLCTDLDRDVTYWNKSFADPVNQGQETVENDLTPPALCNGKVFVGTVKGKVHCLSASTGDEIWSADVGEPIVFQPAVADGRLYVSTADGHLVCIETGDPADDGWFMWGATAAHNGLAEPAARPIAVNRSEEVLV